MMKSILFFMLAANLWQAPLARAETVKITLLGVGDIYNFADSNGRGGFARLNAVAKSEREKNPNTLYFFTGDMLSPSLLSGMDKGAHIIELTNLEPFDLAVPGNHEFDFGVTNFLSKVAASKYPWAAINVVNTNGSPVTEMGGVMLKTLDTVRMAIIPVAKYEESELSRTGDLKFLPSADSAIAAAKTHRAKGADLIVAVTQTDASDDRLLIGSGAFDVILSGDDHVYATYYDGRTAFVETATEGQFLAPLDLTVSVTERDGRRLVKWVPNFRFIDTASVTPDPETQTLVDSLANKLDESMTLAIGTTTVVLDSRRNVVRAKESAIGSLFADALLTATGADLAVLSGGGIRGDRLYEAGMTLTRRDILTELPFRNTTVMVQINGRQLLSALENGLSQVEDLAGRFPQVSGLRLVYDPAAKVGSRVRSVMINGEALDLAGHYKVATSDYLLSGGDGYASFGQGDILIDANGGRLIANDVIDYIRVNGVVDVRVDGRIQVLSQ